ncbi:hypothetical protein ACHAWO_003720 [Cyclotella atomus]|uniref:Uncharacterized protein n=1 Tax=Cyclotella atomus TaxID=382360 RepID=A0ABD3PF79_9STRA
MAVAVKKMAFLPKMGSNAKPETKDVQKNVESAAPDETPVVEEAPESANNLTIETAAETKPSESPSTKRTFLPSKFNFSPGRKGKKEPDAALFNVTCETGPNGGDCDDESVEVNMAAAEKGIDINDDDDEEEEKVESLPTEPEVVAEMTALQKLKSGTDDDDIDLKELAIEIKGKIKGMFRKNKSEKPECEDSDPAKSKSLDEAAVGETACEGKENAAGIEFASDEQAKNDAVATAKQATFMSKFFKSDDKSEKTAPSVPCEEEMHIDGEAAAAPKAGESAETGNSESEVKDASTEKPVAKPGVRSKLTKLFSKNDMTSADAAKNETGNEGAQESADVASNHDLADSKQAGEASASEQKDQAVTDTVDKEEPTKGSGTKSSKFMKKLGIAGVAGALGVAAVKASTPEEQAVVETEQKEEQKNESGNAITQEEQAVADAEQKNEQKNGSGTKSKIMKKLGIVGAAGAVGVAAVTASGAPDDKQAEESNVANENKLEEEEEKAIADTDQKERKSGSGMKSKFMKKLGIAGAAGAVGVGAAAASATDEKQVEQSDVSNENKAEESVEEVVPQANTDEPKEQEKAKGFKSKFMRKLGIAGAAGAAGAAGVAAAKSNNESSLEVIVHADKPVSEAQAESPNVSQAQAGGDETVLDQGGIRRLSSNGDDECSDMDKRADADHSRCGFGDDIHEALMQAGEYMYETCGDPDFGTAKKMLGMMESAESVICWKTGANNYKDEKKDD